MVNFIGQMGDIIRDNGNLVICMGMEYTKIRRRFVENGLMARESHYEIL